METLNAEYFIKVLALYFPPINSLNKKARGASQIKTPRSLRERRHTARLIDLNEYLASFPGTTLSNKIGVTKLNEILLNRMSNICSKESYVQDFDNEYISLKKAVDIFERIDISESIYKSVVERSYKNLPRQMPTVLVTSGIREENMPCHRLTLRGVRALART